LNCCKYIKVPFLKANHNPIFILSILLFIVANISKFLFWKRITTLFQILILLHQLLQIYQSSFFESESQQGQIFFLTLMIVANISKFLFWKRITTEFRCYKPHQLLLQIYQSSFFESESQHQFITLFFRLNCCKYIKVPFLKANHNRNIPVSINYSIVANISKFLFWKRITTTLSRLNLIEILLQIYQSSFFESESQLVEINVKKFFNCCKYIKVPFLKANHNWMRYRLNCRSIVANISKFLFWKRITTLCNFIQNII